jgi:hypothetical protein
MKIGALLLVACLGVISLCQAQSTPKPQGKAVPAKPVPKSTCNLSEGTAKQILDITQEEDFSSDPRIADIQKNWFDYQMQANECAQSGLAAGNKDVQIQGLRDSAVLWKFEAIYNGAKYSRETGLNRVLGDAQKQLSQQYSSLQNQYALLQSRLAAPPPREPLFKQPTPMEMECMPSPAVLGQLECNGFVTQQQPRLILPFDMTCHSPNIRKLQCDGFLTP